MAKKNSSDITKYVVYSFDEKKNKKTYHQSYDDMSDAQEHRKMLQKLYGKFIQVGIDERHGRFKSSVMKCRAILKSLKHG
jgi:hypothetical protein